MQHKIENLTVNDSPMELFTYLPDGDGVFPTLLVRDIYSNGTSSARQGYARWATANGYAFVFQSARGRYDSDGKWYPYFQEINDGDDTLTWIAEQPWSNGKVGMFGSSMRSGEVNDKTVNGIG